jgi:hypothetical protein
VLEKKPHFSSPWLASWVIDPPGMLNQMLVSHVTEEHVLSITQDVDALMRKRWPHAGKYLYIHDFSRVQGYDTAARKILQDWGIASRSEISMVLVVVPQANKILRMGAQAGTTFLRALGVPIEVSSTVKEAVEKYSVCVA